MTNKYHKDWIPEKDDSTKARREPPAFGPGSVVRLQAGDDLVSFRQTLRVDLAAARQTASLAVIISPRVPTENPGT